MDTNMLYYKIYEGDVKSRDYIKWAMNMLDNDCSSTNLNILSGLEEPLNIFEVEDYFNRASREIDLRVPSREECNQYYKIHLLKTILEDKNNAIDLAYEVYKVVREEINTEVFSRWFELSEIIDDFLYSDNVENLTRTYLTSVIVQVAKNQIKEGRM